MIFADLGLARRLEAAEAATGMAVARGQHPASTAVEEMAGGWAIFVGAGSPINHTYGLGLNGPVSAADLDRVEEFFGSRGAPVTLDVCPLAHPSLLEALRGRCYRIAEFASVLVRPLAGEQPGAPDLRIRRAAPEDAGLWIRAASQGFFEREEPAAEELEVAGSIFQASGARCFLACSPEPAAAAAMSVHGGLAAFYADGTSPRFRRAGLQTALIQERLNQAIYEGCDLATASTLPASSSQRNYERLGFRVVYTKVVLEG